MCSFVEELKEVSVVIASDSANENDNDVEELSSVDSEQGHARAQNEDEKSQNSDGSEVLCVLPIFT